MASEDRKVREKQLEKVVAQFEARKSELSQRGLDEKAAKKDTILKNLGAQVKKARKRIVAMDAAAAHVAEMAAKDTKVPREAKAKPKAKAPAPAAGKPAKGGGAKGSKKKGK